MRGSCDGRRFYMHITNRGAVTVLPTQSFIDWVNEVNPHKDSKPVKLEDFHEAHVYLIPEWDTDGECEAMMREAYDYIFADQLWGWYTNESLWPPEKERTWELFSKWFKVIYSSCVDDLQDNEEIIREDV